MPKAEKSVTFPWTRASDEHGSWWQQQQGKMGLLRVKATVLNSLTILRPVFQRNETWCCSSYSLISRDPIWILILVNSHSRFATGQGKVHWELLWLIMKMTSQREKKIFEMIWLYYRATQLLLHWTLVMRECIYDYKGKLACNKNYSNIKLFGILFL